MSGREGGLRQREREGRDEWEEGRVEREGGLREREGIGKVKVRV